jgi:hypothetical protein
MRGNVLDLFDSGQEKLAGCCEHGNEFYIAFTVHFRLLLIYGPKHV